MSSRIKKSFLFTTQEACLFYNCDLPLGYKILKNNKQKMGELVCILVSTGQVFKSQLVSIPHLNVTLEWNQTYFRNLFQGLNRFILQDEQDNQDQDLIQPQTQGQPGAKKPNVSSKTLLVRDPMYPDQEIYILRCKLNQAQFHKGKTGLSRLWQEFEKYTRFMRRQQSNHEKLILELQSRKVDKFAEINQLITKQEKKKNIVKQKLTAVFGEKKIKYLQLNKLHQKNQFQELVQNFGKDTEQSSMNISDISSVEMVNSQEDRPLTGSLFEPSQDYFYRQQERILEQN